MRTKLLVFLFVGLFLHSFAQDPYSPENRLQFAQKMFVQGDFRTASFESQLILQMPDIHPSIRNKTAFILGSASFRLEDDMQMKAGFELMDNKHADPHEFSKAGIGLSWYYIRMNDWRNAHDALNERFFYSDAPAFEEYLILERAGLYLLEDNYPAFESIIPPNKSSNQRLHNAWNELESDYSIYKNRRHPSPAIAGLLSAVLPGTGKFYTGQWGSGVVNLISSAGFAAQAWEGYRVNQWKSAQLYLFSSLFIGYYVSVIYGSVVQAKVFNARLETDFRNRVVLALDIPIRNILQR